jgi:hypothetical protein
VGYGLGVLTLKNYTLGTAFTADNFVEFTYASSIVSFDITASDLSFAQGEFDSLPGQNVGLLDIESYAALHDNSIYAYEFESSATNGVFWQVGEPPADAIGPIKPSGTKGGANADRGFSFTYSVASNADLPSAPGAGVPEPAAWTLMIAGFGLAGSALRRRRQQAGAAL